MRRQQCGYTMANLSGMGWGFTLSILIIIVSQKTQACPYYQKTMPEWTTYDTFADVYAAAVGNDLPIWVCDKAKIEVGEEVPVIAESISIFGEITDHRAHWTAEDVNMTTVFVITADNVVFKDFQLAFVNTAIEVRAGGYVNMDHVRLWFGDTGVYVNTNGAGGTGLEGDHVHFLDVGIGVLIQAGDVICIDCNFENPRNASYVARLSTNFDRLTQFDNTFVDSVIPFGVQSNPTSLIVGATLSAAFVDESSLINCRTYPDSCATFGSAGGSGGNNDGFTVRDIIFIVVFVLAFLVVIAALLATVVQKRRYVENVVIRD